MDEDDLEIVLQWRNSDHIRMYATTQDFISLETHTKWFENIKKKEDMYFIVMFDSQAVGLVWANNFTTNSCETGLYIYEKELQNSLLAYKISLTINDYLFNIKDLANINCEILHSNHRSSRFTLSLGYIQTAKSDLLIHYKLTKSAFEKSFEKISKHLTKSVKK